MASENVKETSQNQENQDQVKSTERDQHVGGQVEGLGQVHARTGKGERTASRNLALGDCRSDRCDMREPEWERERGKAWGEGRANAKDA